MKQVSAAPSSRSVPPWRRAVVGLWMSRSSEMWPRSSSGISLREDRSLAEHLVGAVTATSVGAAGSGAGGHCREGGGQSECWLTPGRRPSTTRRRYLGCRLHMPTLRSYTPLARGLNPSNNRASDHDVKRHRVLSHDQALNGSGLALPRGTGRNLVLANVPPAGDRPGLGGDDRRCRYRGLMCDVGNSLANEDPNEREGEQRRCS
jgi:hypothetical protein